MPNESMGRARMAKNDDYYTRLPDIESECRHYRDHFRGKSIFCNCDDPEYSQFWRYFEAKFEDFKLKRLVITHYNRGKRSFALERTRKGERRIELAGDGDFRSPECIKFLQESDIVITNPPFSLFREYIASLMDHQKKFLVIGNMNAVTYRDFFPLIQSEKIWLGVSRPGIEFYTTPGGIVNEGGGGGQCYHGIRCMVYKPSA